MHFGLTNIVDKRSLPASDQTFTLSWGDYPPTEEERNLLRCYAASDKLRHAFGPRAGDPLTLDLDEADIKPEIDQELCVTHSGFNLHAETVIESEDRDQLERVSRYIQRPVITQDRLLELEDGRFYYRFKRVWKNDAKEIFFEGPDLLERLAALIPPPRKHQLSNHGVYAPNSRLHKAVRRLTVEGEVKRNVVQRRLRHTNWVL